MYWNENPQTATSIYLHNFYKFSVLLFARISAHDGCWLLAFHSSFSQWNLSSFFLFVYRLEKDEGSILTDLLHDLQLEREKCKSLEIEVSGWLVVSSFHLFIFSHCHLRIWKSRIRFLQHNVIYRKWIKIKYLKQICRLVYLQ